LLQSLLISFDSCLTLSPDQLPIPDGKRQIFHQHYFGPGNKAFSECPGFAREWGSRRKCRSRQLCHQKRSHQFGCFSRFASICDLPRAIASHKASLSGKEDFGGRAFSGPRLFLSLPPPLEAHTAGFPSPKAGDKRLSLGLVAYLTSMAPL